MGKSILIEEPSVTNQQINSIIVDPSRVNIAFLYYSLVAKREELFRLAAGGSRTPILNKSQFGKVSVYLPSRMEQDHIAEILGRIDDKVELNSRMTQTLDTMACTIFKSWFVDFEPVREGHPWFPQSWVDSVLGPIPSGWKAAPLDSIATFLNGVALQKFPAGEGEDFLPVIKIAELRRGNTIGSDRAGLGVPETYIVEDGNVLFSWSGTLEVAVWAGGRGALNQHLFKVTSDRYPKWFYLHWIKEHLPAFRGIAASKATTMGHIQRRHLTEALVTVPPAPTMEAMDRVMTPLLVRQLANELESRTLAALRDTLLPKLLSGEIRVKQAEKIVGESV